MNIPTFEAASWQLWSRHPFDDKGEISIRPMLRAQAPSCHHLAASKEVHWIISAPGIAGLLRHYGGSLFRAMTHHRR